jgi:hypothetical protein
MSRVLAFESDNLRVHLHPPRIPQESEVVVPAGWYVARYLGSARDGMLGSRVFLGIEISEDVKFRA